MNVIELKGIGKSYQLGSQTIPVLFDVDLTIQKGEFLSIMGPSGSGKSTLMNILGCLDRPSTGHYLLNDRDISFLNDSELSSVRNTQIGFVFQKFHLLVDSQCLHNISLPLIYRGIPPQVRKQSALQAAQDMGIADRCQHKPNEISGGQAQRVAIARALVGAPSIILADEPTGSLDSKTGREIMEVFHELHARGHTIIMVTHDPNVARAAERIIHIRDGRIVREEINEKKAPSTAVAPVNDDDTGRLRQLDLVWMAVREGLFTHPLRTFLTMLGVLFGVAAVISMMAINEGARQRAIEQIRQMGLNNIRVRGRQMSEDEIREARKNLSMGLNQDDVLALQDIPTIRYLVPIKEVNAEISYGNLKPKGRILATLSVYEKVANFYVQEGRFLNDRDLQFYSRVCILGRIIKQHLFGNEPALGKRLYLGAEMFTVVGVMEGKNIPEGVAKAVSTQDLNSDIYIPLTTALKRFSRKSLENELDEVSIMVTDAHQVRPTAQLVEKLINRRHHKVADFELVVPEELLRQQQETQWIFDVVMICITSISLLVGGIGIMNIMLATVTERIGEIGIRRAVGASQKDVLQQFLVEAVSISTMGGLLGLACGWGLTTVISVFTDWQTIISSTSILLGFGVSTMVGIAFGIYPAWKASLLDPIQALNT